MKIETKEQINSILNFVNKQIESSTVARNKCEPKTPQHLMLSGKVKAYVDIASHITNKFKQKGIDISSDKKD